MDVKFLFLIIVLVLVFELPVLINAKAYNLKLNSTQQNQIITKDTQYYYIDNYFSKCLDLITNCTNGTGVVLNITLGDYPDNDTFSYNKIVLLSSGGDSPYTVGGFYLHQYNINGDKYLEFGVSNLTLLYLTRLYVTTNDSMKLVFIWNSDGLSSYVDGRLYSIISNAVRRPFLDVRFKPIHTTKYIIERKFNTTIWNLTFYDNSKDAFDNEVTNDFGNYLRGYTISDKIQTLKEFLPTDGVIGQLCKTYCISIQSQLYLLSGQKCSCISSTSLLNNHDVRFNVRCVAGSTLCTLWSVYIATHVNLAFDPTSINLNVKKYNIIDPVEIGTPLAFQVSVSLNNTRVYVDFNDGSIKSIINSGFTIYEYNNSGINNINFTAVCLTDTKITDSTQMEIKVVKKADRSPMESVKIYIRDTNDLQVGVRIIANGGSPFLCNISYGENVRNETVKSDNRTLNYSVTRQYPSSGIYNLSVICRNDFRKDVVVSDWGIVYIPDSSVSSSYKDQKYSFDNLNYLYVERKAQKLPDEIDLQLPFKAVPTNLKFDIIDLQNPSNTFSYIHTKRQASTTNYIIKLSSGYLNKDKISFMVKTNDIYLATYIITIQDKLDIPPQIFLKNNPIKIADNEPGMFVLNITQTYPYSILKFDYGDGVYEIFDIDGTEKGFLVELEHKYTKVGQYFAVASVSNYISTIQTSMKVPFELKLAEFQLTIKSNVTDITEDVVFTIKKAGGNVVTPIDSISFKENDDDNDSNLGAVIQKEYIFNAGNSFSYTFVYKFKKHGLYKPVFQISSMAGIVKNSIVVKVGQDLDGITAFAFNNYALVNEFVKVYLRIDNGNGYDVSVKFTDNDEMIIPWAYIASNGIHNNSTKLTPNQVRPLAQIVNKNIMYILLQYTNPGEYLIKIKVSNPFSTLRTELCARTIIAPALSQFQSQSTCSLSNENTFVRLVEDIDNKNDTIKLAKSLPNTLRVLFSQCQPENLIFYWTITSLRDRVPNPISKYCFVETQQSDYVLDKGELEFGIYNLTVTVVSNSNPSYYRQLKNKQLLVDLSKIVAKIKGEKEIYLGWNETYTLDFYSSSFDPEAIDQKNKDNLNFDIICSKDLSLSSTSDEINKLLDASINAGDYDFEKLNFQLAFSYLNIKFYQRDCFHFTEPEYLATAIEFDMDSKIFYISMKTLTLNESSIIPITIRLYVRDPYRVSKVDQILNLNTTNSFLAVPAEDLDKMSEQLDKLDDLASTDPKLALNLMSKFTDAINNFETTTTESSDGVSTTTVVNNEAQSKLTNMRGKVLGTMDKIVDGVDDIASVQAAAGATASVTSNSDQMPTDNQNRGSLVLEKMGEKAKSFKGMDPGDVTKLAGSVLDAGGNVYSAAAKSLPMNENNRTLDLNANETEEVVVELPKKISAPLIFYQCEECEDFPEERFEQEQQEKAEKERIANENRAKTAEIAQRSVGGISGVAEALTSAATDKPAKVESKSLSLTVAKKSVNDDSGSSVDSDAIAMPKFGDIFKDTSGMGSVSTKLIVSKSNPYQSASSSSSVQGSIVTLSLSDDSGTDLEVNGTSKPFVIKIPASEDAPEALASVPLLGFNYHKTLLDTNTSALGIMITPEIEGDFYHVYISYTPNKTINEYPSETSHDYAYTIPNNNETDDAFKYRIFLTSNETKGNGTYYIGIKLIKLANKTKSEKEINSTHISYYKIRMFVSSCKYWHVKAKEWRTDGCEVSPLSTHKLTECLCYHLTTFGSDFYVPPNTIDFKNVWAKFKNLSDNAAVFATVISLLGLYVIVAIWARWKDKKDLIKWGASPLVDNLPSDSYYYLVSVQTGVGNETATTSNVGLFVVGENSESGVRKLSDGKRKGFKSGSVMNFIMSVEEPLGPLTYIRVWHDNSGSGKNASWYLNLVNILDIQTNEKFHFVCDNWLGVEKSDGQIDRILPVASNNDLAGFKHLFTKSVKKKFFDGHLWFSVFSRPTKSNFTRLQRISCCLSLLFCTMIANAMFYRADEGNTNKTAVQLGPIKFTLSQVFTSVISTLIVVPVNLIIVSIFRKAKIRHAGVIPTKSNYIARKQYWRRVNNHNILDKDVSIIDKIKSKWSKFAESCSAEHKTIEYRRDEELEKKNKKQGRNLPFWTIYIAWALCFISTIVPAFFIILYSMEWGRDRSNAWLASISLSFFQSVLVVDPLKVFVITAVITFLLRKPDDDDDDLLDSGDPFYNAIANRDEEFLSTTASVSQVNIQEVQKSRNRKLLQLQTIDSEELKQLREERLRQIKMNEILREMASYMFFLVILLFLCHQSRHTNSSIMHSNLKKMFLENPAMVFDDVKTRPDFWTYLETVFLPNLYAPPWYNNKTLTWREKLALSDRYSIRVGAPRLRQLRVKSPSCRVPPMFKTVIKNCRNSYNWIDDDAKSYNVSWVKIANQTDDEPKEKCKTPWCYQSTVQTKSVPIVATFASYKGGGYVVTLGRTLNKSLEKMYELRDQGWLDQLTRAIFFEFTVFNPNVNLFASATFVLEYLSTGAAITYTDLKVFRLYNYVGSFGVVVLAFQIIYIIFLIYFIVTEILKIKSQKKEYFKQFWNLNELVMIILSIVSIGMYAMKNTFTTLAMKAVRESELGEFVNFNTIALWDDTFATILATVSFCATLKFLKLLRFNKRIGMLAETLKYASNDLKSFSFTFIVFMLAYAQFGFLLFNSSLKSYRNFMSAIESVFLLLLGQFEMEMFDANPILGFFYFMSFIFLIIVGLMAIFMTILTDAFESVKADLENQSNEHEIFDYMLKSFKKVTGLDKKLKKKEKEEEVEEEDGDDDEKEEMPKQQQLKRPANYFGSHISMTNIRQGNKVEPKAYGKDALIL